MTENDITGKYLDGEILLIDKPYAWTSFDAVKKVKSLLGKYLDLRKIKVGHAGTLDPLATGLVILCTGKATKKIQEIQDQPKEYLATVELGKTTPSYDLETEINNTFSYEHVTREAVLTVLESFTGSTEQTPPIFSAKKIDGKRAYDLARKGTMKNLKPVEVTIHEIKLVNLNLPKIDIKVTCSKGTYIRSLAHDIGKTLDSGAFLAALKRTAIGDHKLEKAVSPEEFENYLKIITTN